MEKNILIGHGSGGKLSHKLIRELFLKYFDNPILSQQGDSAILDIDSSRVSFTTDSYVIDPLFFPGGNIGKLAVCGTVNDLAVSGAAPKYISAAFIIEEGLPLEDLEAIVSGMADEASKANVMIVTGDTKVVNRGQCDKLFINTSGIGILDKKFFDISSGQRVDSGDRIIINGPVASHGMAVMAARSFEGFDTEILSDCASLNGLIGEVLATGADVKFMRDATRGGLATVLCEMAENTLFGVEIDEEAVPVDENVKGMCELLGFDPFYVANEGKVVMVVAPEDADKVIETMNKNPLGEQASLIGEVSAGTGGRALLKTSVGGKRIMDMLAGGQLPRIC